MTDEWATCKDDHVCCGGAICPGHYRPADTCGDCAAMKDTLVASVEDECPTCGAYVLNHALHANWHRDIAEAASSYVSPPVYGGLR